MVPYYEGGYVILTQNPKNFLRPRVKMTPSGQKILRKKKMKFHYFIHFLHLEMHLAFVRHSVQYELAVIHAVLQLFHPQM